MAHLEFWSSDNRFGLRVSGPSSKKLLRLCRNSSPDETGGLLLGHYSGAHDCALVTSVTEAPPDSQSGRTWFVRGVRGLQSKIDLLWRRRCDYYIGEWHFHPYGSPDPSTTDINQLRDIAHSKQYHCPEPVLLIIGGEPPKVWSARAFVFPRSQKKYIEMLTSKSQTPGLLAVNFS